MSSEEVINENDEQKQTETVNKDIKMPEEVKEKNNLQMWSAISFAVILIGLGIPVWWKTTETYRVSIPYSRIDRLSELNWCISVKISVYTSNSAHRVNRIREIQSYFPITKLFNVTVVAEHMGESLIDIQCLEASEREAPREHGNVILVELDALEEIVFIGNERAIYFTPLITSQKLADIIKNQILLEELIDESIGTKELSRHSSDSGTENNINKIKLAPRYEIIFTNIVPEPEVVKLHWDSEKIITSYITPMINQLLPLVHLSLKSQWLYFVEFGLGKKKKQHNNTYVYEMNGLSLTTSLLDKKLGLRVSQYPCFNFVLHTARCDESPLLFQSGIGHFNHVLIPQWGGIQILNPSEDNCNNNTPLKPDPDSVMSVFIGQVRSILGLKNYLQHALEVKWLPLKNSRLREWEFDGLVRIQILELVTSARLTLQALTRLLDKVNNIVINEEVGYDIMRSLEYIEICARSIKGGNLMKALNEAHIAYSAAETAFAHPSLLSLLYFPDDQKYAIYIPLFLPIMIPVMISIRNIIHWLKYEEAK